MLSFLSSGYNIILAEHKLFLTEAHVCQFVRTVLAVAQIAHLISLKLILASLYLTISDISQNKRRTIKYEIIYSEDMGLKSRSDLHTRRYSERTRKLWHDVGVRGKIV